MRCDLPSPEPCLQTVAPRRHIDVEVPSRGERGCELVSRPVLSALDSPLRPRELPTLGSPALPSSRDDGQPLGRTASRSPLVTPLSLKSRAPKRFSSAELLS